MHGKDNTDHDPSTVVEYGGDMCEEIGRNTMTAKGPIRAFFL
jgi:hypothetical protein